MSPTPPEHLISYCFRLWSWFLIIWEGLVWFLDFWKTSHFCRVVYPHSRRFWKDTASLKLLVFLNSVLDTQNDLKPTIIQYNICCTYKKRLDYVVRSEKKWKGGSGGSGEGKNRSKKGSFDPKTAENRALGVLRTPQTSQK